jgi:hypothetical protein
VVADEHQAVSANAAPSTATPPSCPPAARPPAWPLRREAHARILGNGLCTRPAEPGCRRESAGETCAYVRAGVEFLPTLIRQRDHAREHGQNDRATLFIRLIENINGGTPCQTSPA